MDGRLTWTDCDETGDYVVPNVLSPRDLVSRPDNMDETVPHVRPLNAIGVPRGPKARAGGGGGEHERGSHPLS